MDKSAKKRQFELYETPRRLTRTLLRSAHHSLWYPDTNYTICEPCVGDRKILDVLKPYFTGAKFITNDLDPDHEADYHINAQKDEFWQIAQREHGQIDFTITNPPFSAAIEILKRAYAYSNRGVAMLLRLTFLEPTKLRESFLKRYPPNQMIIFGQPRPSFTRDGNTDSVTTAWFIWDKLTPNMFYTPVFVAKWKK